jgi:Domain of unknown function (DUF4105)
MLQRLAFVFILLYCTTTASETLAPMQEWILQARKLQLYTSTEWLSLVHYRPNILGDGFTSFTDGLDFFLAADGKTNPQAELEATLQAIALPVDTTSPDSHAQCRFIARYHWLMQVLSISHNEIPNVTCAAFQEWYNTINPARVTLVFPSAYINNPSSMFGHTLLRIDPPDSKFKTTLTSYSISYAAATTEFNGLVFAVKGLTGGYAGYFSIQPYYDKVNEYSDLENRDIWEYELNLLPAEVRRLMEHAWELHKTAFEYYFLDENCSFQLLTLLDVARPGMNLTAEFPLAVIPADTVRTLLKQQNILAKVTYRPSNRSNLTYWLNNLPIQQQDWVIEYGSTQSNLNDVRLTSLTLRDQAQLLDVSYEYVQYQYRRRILPRNVSAAKSLELLTRRSQLADTKPLDDAPQPVTRPDQGHLSTRVIVGYGSLAESNFLQLQWRPAYHDLLDNDQGHVAGSQINFLDLSLRKFNADKKIQLERLALIDIFSITPTNRYFSALSWHFDTGYERLALERITPLRRLVYTVNGGAGYTLAVTPDLKIYGMLDASAIIYNDYANSLGAGVGIRAGMLWQILPQWKLHFEGRTLNIRYHDNQILQSLQLGQSYTINSTNSLRLYWQRSGSKQQLLSETLLSWHHYY